MFYLDRAATSPVRREVLEAMWPYLTGVFGNPSSTHEVGDQAARGLRDARASVAAALGCRPAEVVFTSGGTEADNLAVKGIALGARPGTPLGALPGIPRRIVTTPIEHEAVLASCDHLVRLHGFVVELVPVGPDGRVDPDALAEVLTGGAALVSIAHADNEIGTVQDIPALAAVAHAAGVPFHTDAVQSAPWLPVGLDVLGVDAVSVSGHKLGAPKGIGALAVRSRVPLEPLLHGGGQERGSRSGTENVAGAVALATAFDLVGATRDVAAAVACSSRDIVIQGVLDRVPGAVLTGSREHRLPGHASFCFPGTNGETVLLELEQRGIVSSSGSACAAGSTEVSHVLTAIGLPDDLARTAVRFTFDDSLGAEDAARVVASIADAVAAVRLLGA
ncbi:cysteine desulfurase family protein [Curtobacterium sp. Leaf261]|uniref:cysteine desulfurase family protein n=1 Tax=Curtobacterium sp. Leaf261 TaxID=1736311 RepID=UPI0006F75BA4|nr:cysteine desulfurase family protein [Curtobacterium sp. Leaf261]KQO62390.1 cysteine desulfurase [Curtobacterium sp. Leaf261]